MSTPEMKKLKKSNLQLYEKTLEEKFPDFVTRNYGIFQLLISGGNIDILIKMLSSLDKVNKREESIDKVVNDMRDLLTAKYVSPILKK
jgi:hypothetical protein